MIAYLSHEEDINNCVMLYYTQTGQRHGSQMDGVHGIWSFVQSPDKLEVEDPTNQTTDTACRK